MTKTQKIWLWISVTMFALPEILFLFTPLSILSFINNFSEISVNPPIYYIVNQQFFIDNQIIMLLTMFIEWLGVLGLLLQSIKFNKKIFAILLGIILVWLSILFYISYVISFSVSFF